MMRVNQIRAWVIALGVASAIPSACGSAPKKPATIDSWEITTSVPAFVGTQASGAFSTTGSGQRAYGACLLADLHDAKACETASDCADGAKVDLQMGHFEYCVAPEGQTKKTCWTRNGADPAWCNKAPPPGRDAGSFSTPAIDAAQRPASGEKTRWITYGCLNAGTYPMFSDGPLPPCASSDPAAAAYKVYSASSVSTYVAP